MDRKLVLCIAGMPGAGKTTVARFLTQFGYAMVSMGDVLRKLARSAGLPASRESLSKLVVEVRRRDGPATVAAHCVAAIKRKRKPVVVVDGLRSLEEVGELARWFRTYVVFVDCPPDLRFDRLRRRGRPDDPTSREQFAERDALELAIGVGAVAAKADYAVANDGDLSDLRERVGELVAQIEGRRGVR